MPKVLVSLPEDVLASIDSAARRAGESRSAFIRRVAQAEALRNSRPIDDPAARRAYLTLLRLAGSCKRMTTVEAIAARDRGRR